MYNIVVFRDKDECNSGAVYSELKMLFVGYPAVNILERMQYDFLADIIELQPEAAVFDFSDTSLLEAQHILRDVEKSNVKTEVFCICRDTMISHACYREGASGVICYPVTKDQILNYFSKFVNRYCL